MEKFSSILLAVFVIYWAFSSAIRFQLTPWYTASIYRFAPISQDTQFDNFVRNSFANQIISYLRIPNYNLRIRSPLSGYEIGISIAEQQHLQDVKKIVIPFTRLYVITSLIFLLSLGVLINIEKDNNLIKAFDQALKIFIGFTIFFVISVIFFWNQFFTFFHQGLFPQGNWQFPEDSFLIRVFPEEFWIISFVSTFLLTLFIIWFGRAMISRVTRK